MKGLGYVSSKGEFGRCDICGSDHPQISNFLMGCPSQYHKLVDPRAVERLKETLSDVYSELTCMNSASVSRDWKGLDYHLVRAINKIGDPRSL